MIFDTSQLPSGHVVRADLVVVGSGAGGATVAMVAAEAGLDVVVLEAGSFITPGEMNQREEEMLPRLLWDSGARTTVDRAVRIHQGKGVGGSTLHNLNLCKRIPSSILSSWHRDRALSHLPLDAWDRLYTEVESLIGMSEVSLGLRSRHNQLLQRGCEALGWAGGPTRHNRTGCVGSGFCEVGCAYDGKNNALKVMITRAVKAGARILTHCQAVRVSHRGGGARGVEAALIDPVTGRARGELRVEATKVCLSASATATAALLLRSRVPDPGGETGRGLRVHPAVVVAGVFDEPVRAWEGIPQSYECTEWLDFDDRLDSHRLWLIPAFAHPMGLATMLPGHGPVHAELMGRYAHLGAFTAMLHDRSAGTVEPRGDLGLGIDYWPDDEDRRELALGFEVCAKLLLAAGARRVTVPAATPLTLRPGEDLGHLRHLEIHRGEVALTAVHPMASVPMGDDPSVAAVDSAGRHHHLAGLWVADASLFPTSIGVPPQLSTYAMGLHVGRGLVEAG